MLTIHFYAYLWDNVFLLYIKKISDLSPLKARMGEEEGTAGSL